MSSHEISAYHQARKRFGINCDICDNTGEFTIECDDGMERKRKCKCRYELANRLRIEKSGIANRIFRQYTFNTYYTCTSWQENVKKNALKFLKEQEKWFFINGIPGSGKSHICIAICQELLKTRRLHYMSWREAIVSLKSLVTNHEEYYNHITILKEIDVLYIDDFLKGKITEADINIAFEIINRRYITGSTTLISTELSIDAILQINEAVGSRIYQMSEGYQFSLQSENNNLRLWQ